MPSQIQKRLRITFVTNGCSPGGYQDQFLSYAREFKATHELSILFIFPVDKDSPIVKEFEHLGVRVSFLGSRARVSALSIWRTYTHFLSAKPQVIHSQHPIAGVNAKVAGWLYKRKHPDVKIICEQRNMPEGLSWPARLLEYMTFPAADVILCSSTGVEKSYFGSSKMLNVAGFAPKARKHYTFYNSIDANFAASAKCGRQNARAFYRSEWGVHASDFVFVTVAKMTRQKDYPTLISAFTKALEIVDSRTLKLICVGGGPGMSEVKDLVERLNVQDFVVLTGYRSDVPRILSGADCFVLTSLWEGLPKALLEAMSIPLPCVGTQVAGTEDVIRHEIDGILVPPGDITACAKALVRLVDDPMLSRTLRENGAKRLKSFSVHEQAQTLLGIYDKLYSSPLQNRSRA